MAFDKKHKPKGSNRGTLPVIFVLIFMLGLSFASVPLYRMFCQVTGFGGTPRVEISMPGKVLPRTIKIIFNTDVDRGVPWSFKALQKELIVKVGEPALALFEVQNLSPKAMRGWAIYNVTPHKVGQYFVKMQCFCFGEQIIPGGSKTHFPVSFYIDPAIDDHKNLKDVKVITLSYTFFEYTNNVNFSKMI